MTATVTLVRERPQLNGWYCPTPTGQAIQALLRQCQIEGQLGLVVGHPGCGKTAALLDFCEQNAGSIYLRAGIALARPQAVLVRLCERAGSNLTWPNMPTRDAQAELRRVIGSGRSHVIIIDEAQYLEDPALHLVRDLLDGGFGGIVLAGNKELMARLQKKPNGMRSGFAHLMGRVGPVQEYEAPLDEDIERLAAHYPLAADARLIFTKVAKRYNLHRADKLVKMAQRTAPGAETLGAANLRAAAELLNINLRT